ncbi:MAG: FHA domain-containing protein [Myxococcota bacterium]
MDDIDLDILRGWAERVDVEVAETHALPALAQLVRIGDESDEIETIHGPDVLIGRHANQYGPVDLIPSGLEDHENYRLGAPHLQLTRAADGSWLARSVSPRASTKIDGQTLVAPDGSRPIEHGAELELGVVRYRFEIASDTLDRWKARRSELLASAEGAALFLMLRGGPTDVSYLLDESSSCVVGRSFPAAGELLKEAPWDELDQPDWDLSALPDVLRKFVAYRHAEIVQHDGTWWLRSLANRHRTYLNRELFDEHVRLSAGDDIGLGSTLLLFHAPDEGEKLPRPIEPPAVVDWQEDSSPILDEEGEQ